MLRHEQQALDAMQDVFVQLLARKDTLDDRGLSSLLYRVATNVCLNKIRSKSRRPEDSESELLSRIAGASKELDQAEARSVLDALLGREPESTGTIAVMHLHDGFTLEEVAREVGMSVSGVRKRIRKLRAGLPDLEGEQ
jgi:RNA polymerase sigma-70 factor (ECF subfamily)